MRGALTLSFHEAWIGDFLRPTSGQVLFGTMDDTVKTFWVTDEGRGSHA
jgi:hypothetical protein